MRHAYVPTLAALTLALLAAPVPAAAPGALPAARAKGLGDPGKLTAVTLDTGRTAAGKVTLAGRDASQQLIVTGRYATGQVRDLTHAASYTSAPAGVVRIDAGGRVTPLKEGEATVTAAGPGGVKATVRVAVTHLVDDLPVSFANQVVPVFTKFGCNAGGCHGKAGGQNGFRLSLLGFEPAEDYEYIVKEARGRRVFPAAPDHSLLLTKATGAAPHGGGKRLDRDGPDYAVLRRWVEQGTPKGKPADPAVSRIEVFPKERLLDLGGTQQLVVVAHLTDGSTADVTRTTQFESNAADVAAVDEGGRVTAKHLAGSAAVMARYGAHVDVFRAAVPLGAPVTDLPPAKGFVDELVYKNLKKLGLPPSELADDGTFIRRATIDIAGRLPTRAETEAFVADADPAKVEKLIDRLLASEDYAYYFANKWAATLRNRRRGPTDGAEATAAFHGWIKTSLHENKPYDRFVREVLTVVGEEGKDPPVVWYREVKDAASQLEDASQLFLGQRLACAKCHHHPFEKWSQDDYYGMAAFFARVEVKEPPPMKGAKKDAPRPPATVAFTPGEARATNPKTNKPVKPTGLGGPALDVPRDADPRGKLVDWMVQKDNPFFARTLANRYWKHFLGRGLVEPEDDLRVTNPPTNPELLDALAKSFVESGYDLKKLVRTICTSNAYRLSAVPNAHNADDRQNYSRYLPKRLHAEVLLDAIDDVTLAKTTFKGAPGGTRAVRLPDNLFDSYFLSVFGRPDAASACECERSGDATLAQALHMFNSAEITAKAAGPRAAALAKDKRPVAERLTELYLVALSREPTEDEVAAVEAYLRKKGNGQPAFEDLVWALINTKEFLFNH